MNRIFVYTLIGLVFMVAACGPFGIQVTENNQVRRAVYEYERQRRGKPDDLVIHYNRTEPRVRFDGQSENNGRTVWLFSLAAKEYFALLPPGRTYLYIQEIQFDETNHQAMVPLFRGDAGGYVGRELLLAKNGDGSWQVTEDRIIE